MKGGLMKNPNTIFLLVLLVVMGVLQGCGGSNGSAPEPSDDPNPVLEGFGDLTRGKEVLDEETLTSAISCSIAYSLDFGSDPYDVDDFADLSIGGQTIIDEDTTGGSSLLSWVFAFEVLYRGESAELLKTENEIVYDDPNGDKADFLISINGHKLGVEVARAVNYPATAPYTSEAAEDLINAQLEKIQWSSVNVSDEDQWEKEILVVVAYDGSYAEFIETAWDNLEASVKGDTILLIITTDGDDDFIY